MYRNFFQLSTAVMVTVVLSACSNLNQPNQTIQPSINHTVDIHTSQNALDWQGTYEGITPCADCEGIATQLHLFHDGTYKLSTQYLGKNKKVFVEKGTFTWDQHGRVITLNNLEPNTMSTRYQVGENQLFQLDGEGQRITGDLANRFILNKVTNMSIENTKWQLIELFGKPVQGSVDTHYLLLMSDKHQVSAKAGCNTMFGGYEIKGASQLRFKQMASTMMACSDMADEEGLAKVLSIADNYTIADNILSLNKARMAPLARFKSIPNQH